MSADLDMSQYLGLFLQEAEEQLAILEQETILLEKEPSDDRMNIIFRAAHTLKGSSRAMGFGGFADLTHEMENVLELLRSHRLTVSTPIANALLQCQDALGAMKDQIADGILDAPADQELIKVLQSFQDLQPGQAHPAPNIPDAVSSLDLPADLVEALNIAAEGQQVFHAHITLSDDCVMKFVRAFMVINAVTEKGELLACVPERELLEEEKFEFDFDLVFSSEESVAVLEKRLQGVGEIKSIELKTWGETSSNLNVETAAPIEPSAETAEDQVASSTPSVSQVIAPATPAAAPEVASNKPASPRKSDSGQTVRVDVARLDELMNLVGELVIDRTRLSQIGASLAAKFELDENVEALAETVGHIARITSDLQDQIMKARMLPIETVFNRFPRMIRDLAQKLGKEIDLQLSGGETELDRSVIEVIGDPLIHILRNSVDHGVELPKDRIAKGKNGAGKVTVSARHQENHIVIEIEDDGRGIDVERVKAKAVSNGLISQEQADRMTEKDGLQLIFASGLSTAAQISDVSGRGVGMDIVRSNIQKLGGIIDVETKVGEGSRFSLRLPLTLAIIRGLLVRVDKGTYVLPLGSVVETLLIPLEEIQSVNKREVVVIRGVTTPIVRLSETFGFGVSNQVARTENYVVVVGIADQRVGLVVDNLVGEQEVVIKSISRFCGEIRGISGATILGDGNVALIVDVNGVLGQQAA